MWNDGNEAKFLYSPPSALFFTDQGEQTLNIELTAAPKTNGDPRYAILGYSTKKKKRKNQGGQPDDLFGRIEFRKKGSSNFTELSPRHKFPMDRSDPSDIDHVEEMKFTLRLNKENRDTYITVIVMDMDERSIIDCDPQAENGTKT